MIDEKTSALARDTFTRFLQGRKLRKTTERFAILDAVMSLTGHFVIEELMDRVASTSFNVSRATVYNTMTILIDSGLVRRYRFAGQPPQYEFISGTGNHYHLVCTQCGKIREVHDTEIERLLNARRHERFFPEYYSVSIYGLCSRCHRKNRRTTT